MAKKRQVKHVTLGLVLSWIGFIVAWLLAIMFALGAYSFLTGEMYIFALIWLTIAVLLAPPTHKLFEELLGLKVSGAVKVFLVIGILVLVVFVIFPAMVDTVIPPTAQQVVQESQEDDKILEQMSLFVLEYRPNIEYDVVSGYTLGQCVIDMMSDFASRKSERIEYDGVYGMKTERGTYVISINYIRGLGDMSFNFETDGDKVYSTNHESKQALRAQGSIYSLISSYGPTTTTCRQYDEWLY